MSVFLPAIPGYKRLLWRIAQNHLDLGSHSMTTVGTKERRLPWTKSLCTSKVAASIMWLAFLSSYWTGRGILSNHVCIQFELGSWVSMAQIKHVSAKACDGGIGDIWSASYFGPCAEIEWFMNSCLMHRSKPHCQISKRRSYQPCGVGLKILQVFTVFWKMINRYDRPQSAVSRLWNRFAIYILCSVKQVLHPNSHLNSGLKKNIPQHTWHSGYLFF